MKPKKLSNLECSSKKTKALLSLIQAKNKRERSRAQRAAAPNPYDLRSLQKSSYTFTSMIHTTLTQPQTLAVRKVQKAQKQQFQQLDRSKAAALLAIKHYYKGLIAESELERDVILESVSEHQDRVVINFHGLLGENRQSIALSAHEYQLATNQLSVLNGELAVESRERCSFPHSPLRPSYSPSLSEKAYLEEHHAFLKPLSNVLPEWDLYARIPGLLTSEKVGHITKDVKGRWMALDNHALTLAKNLPTKHEAIKALLCRHAKKSDNVYSIGMNQKVK